MVAYSKTFPLVNVHIQESRLWYTYEMKHILYLIEQTLAGFMLLDVRVHSRHLFH